jgi:hypothetical protein
VAVVVAADTEAMRMLVRFMFVVIVLTFAGCTVVPGPQFVPPMPSGGGGNDGGGGSGGGGGGGSGGM